MEQLFLYDAYGEAVAFFNIEANALAQASLESTKTNYLHDGEFRDSHINAKYLRARWQQEGRFTSLDPYSGDVYNPLSFHKYGFVHGDPIQGVDPSGLRQATADVYGRVGTQAHWAFSAYIYLRGWSTKPGKSLATILPQHFARDTTEGDLKPDLLDVPNKRYFELKPVTWRNERRYGLIDDQMRLYDNALQKFGYHRGNSSSIVPTVLGLKMPIGAVYDSVTNEWYAVRLSAAEKTLGASRIDGRGVIWYQLDTLDTLKNQPEDIRRDIPLVDIPESVRVYPYVADPSLFFVTLAAPSAVALGLYARQVYVTGSLLAGRVAQVALQSMVTRVSTISTTTRGQAA